MNLIRKIYDKLRRKPLLVKPVVIASASLELGLYDSANGKSVKAYKMADATILCSDSKRCVIKYANVVRGRIAQICDWYEPNQDLGVNLHYHINEMSIYQLANDEVFISRCLSMAVNPFSLAQFIYENQ